MDKALLIQNLCGLLLDDKRQECIDFVNKNYPFINNLTQKRHYSKYQMCKVFLRDGFIDRYSGDKLLFPGLIKILTIEFPNIFKYHRNWKMSDTHMIYWDLFPTIDHLIPALKFHYKIIIAKKFPYSGIIYIIAFDNSQRIMMAQGEELDCDIDFEK